MSKTIEQLQAARALIERGWCQQHMAVNAAGTTEPCYEGGNIARVCAYGAITLVDAVGADADRFLLQAAKRHGCRGYINFNDTPGRTQAEVLALFDEAIELAKGATP